MIAKCLREQQAKEKPNKYIAWPNMPDYRIYVDAYVFVYIACCMNCMSCFQILTHTMLFLLYKQQHSS